MTTESAATDSLAMAQAVARRLCDEAIWDGAQAIWLGDEKEEVAGNWEVVHKSLGGDLYGGSAGIGLFLTRLWRATGEDRYRTTALGAFAHAVQWHRRLRPGGSLYSGSAGVAVALAEGGGVFDSAELREEARGIALDAMESLPRAENDLIAGRSGSVIALLAVARILDLPEATAAAQKLGRELAADAQETPEGGAAWPSDIGGDEPPLCGLAHGASGPALALGELATLDDDDRLNALAAAAARYERSWYDREQENWPDLRELTRTKMGSGGSPASPLYWCHGAIGIGLVRLRQFERTGSTMAAVEAGAALQSAEKYLALRADDLHADLSQCHGVAALAELFLEGARVFGQPALRQLAGDCVELAAAASGHGASPWPCGVPEGGENPSLMLGMAGIGMMFLRCADPTVAPVGLLYTEPIMRKRVIVKLKGQTTTEGLSRRADELSEMVPGSRVERFSRSGRVLLRLPDEASTADAIERLDQLQDVVYAEADVIDSAQDS